MDNGRRRARTSSGRPRLCRGLAAVAALSVFLLTFATAEAAPPRPTDERNAAAAEERRLRMAVVAAEKQARLQGGDDVDSPDPDLVSALDALASHLTQRKAFSEAEPVLRRLVDMFPAIVPRATANEGLLYVDALARNQSDQGRHDEAIGWWVTYLDRARMVRDWDYEEWHQSLSKIVQSLSRPGSSTAALELSRNAMTIVQTQAPVERHERDAQVKARFDVGRVVFRNHVSVAWTAAHDRPGTSDSEHASQFIRSSGGRLVLTRSAQVLVEAEAQQRAEQGDLQGAISLQRRLLRQQELQGGRKDPRVKGYAAALGDYLQRAGQNEQATALAARLDRFQANSARSVVD